MLQTFLCFGVTSQSFPQNNNNRKDSVCLSVCRKANILVSILVDVALGMLLISWLYRDNHITMLANALVPAADVSVCHIS